MPKNLPENDQAERRAALNPRQSFIVQAPAGSGKTELLIQRFLTLLNHVKTPEEILAITFTKKAANEMRTRVISALKYALTEPEPEAHHAKLTWQLAKLALARNQQFNWHLIENPNQLCIQTIDSLCAYLTRQLPILSQFGSSPEIVLTPGPLYREAVQEVLMHVEENYEWSQAIALLLLHLDNDLNNLHHLLISLLARRDQWLPYIQFSNHDAQIKKQLEQHLANIITDALTSLRNLIPQELHTEIMAIANFAIKQDSSHLPGTKVTDKEAWLGIAKLLLTKDFNWRKRVDDKIGFPALNTLKNPNEKLVHKEYRQRFAYLIEKLSAHEAVRAALENIFYLPYHHYQNEQWNILQALLQILKIATAQLRVTFEQHGQIDFIENAQAALLALGSSEHPTDLALALDYQIQHILVDEFQDTSSTQYQLLEKLITGWEENDGRSLFVVGDPMQSIYRFREAEVGLFIRMVLNGIGNIKLIPLTLTQNFRSEPSIVNWVNTNFQPIFPSFNDMATGAVQYSPSVAKQENTECNAGVEVRGFLTADTEMQAQQIITSLQQIITNHPQEKIAILVRSRTHLSAIIPALKRANISYHAIDIDPLASRQCIQDLLSLTCALLHPADRIAWLAVLRAPWCGLTLADLFILANENPFVTLWEQLERRDILAKLSSDGRERLEKIVPVLKEKIAARGRCSLRDWIENTWMLLGGPAVLKEYADNNDAQAFFRLLEELNQTSRVLNIDKLKERINQLYASTQEDDCLLQIMTIHTAKGLEFDTVILPHLERKMPNDDKPLLAWMEHPLLNDEIALLLAPIHAAGDAKNSTYEFIIRQQKIKSDYEIDRLLYVAATRAKKRLFLFFASEKRENGELITESGSFLKKLWPQLASRSEEYLNDVIAPEMDLLAETPVKMISRLTTTWKNPLQSFELKQNIAHQQQDGFLLKDNKPVVIGVITHKILQQIATVGLDWWQQQSLLQREQYLHQHLLQAGLVIAYLDEAAAIIQKAVENMLHDARGLWILHAHRDAKSEFAMNAVIDGEVKSLVIDRTFIDENGIRWIIDYKTTAFTDYDLQAFLANEQQKYLEKMHLYFHALQLKAQYPTRLGLYFPAVPAWKEWEVELPTKLQGF